MSVRDNLSNALHDYERRRALPELHLQRLELITAVGGATFSYSGGDGQRSNLTGDGTRTLEIASGKVEVGF